MRDSLADAPELVGEVLSLLAADADDFLESGPLGLPTRAPPVTPAQPVLPPGPPPRIFTARYPVGQ